MERKVLIDFTEGEGLEKVEWQGWVTMKRLNFSETNALEEEATDIKIFGTTPQIKVSTSKIKELAILKSIVLYDVKKITYYEDRATKEHKAVENGYSLDITGIKGLPKEIGEDLFLVYDELNKVGDRKKG